VVHSSCDETIVELYDVHTDEMPAGRVGIDIVAARGDTKNCSLGGVILRTIRTEDGRVFALVKFATIPTVTLNTLQRIAATATTP
jgi:hypothetical protein